MLRDIFDAWLKNGLPEGFEQDNVRPAMNMNSGYVFLVNDDYQVAMMNGDELEIYHTLPYSGLEGFISELLDENNLDDLHNDDIEYIRYASPSIG
jgi:hypothetical protein